MDAPREGLGHVVGVAVQLAFGCGLGGEVPYRPAHACDGKQRRREDDAGYLFTGYGAAQVDGAAGGAVAFLDGLGRGSLSRRGAAFGCGRLRGAGRGLPVALRVMGARLFGGWSRSLGLG